MKLGSLVVSVIGFVVLAFALSTVLGVVLGFFLAVFVLGIVVGLKKGWPRGAAVRPSHSRIAAIAARNGTTVLDCAGCFARSDSVVIVLVLRCCQRNRTRVGKKRGSPVRVASSL